MFNPFLKEDQNIIRNLKNDLKKYNKDNSQIINLVKFMPLYFKYKPYLTENYFKYMNYDIFYDYEQHIKIKLINNR